MIITREQVEEREMKTLAPYAVKSSESKGREHEESEGGYRTCFQRDRDRVIHSKSFRRLKGKTQVFVANYGDHYRSRLTHTMEVAQISRDIARILGLNEDLAETIALAHDLGHTPFGHAGQDSMNRLMKGYGSGFEHNEQSRRVVEYLEQKKPDFFGLNLSFEVRDGLIKHRTSFDKPSLTDQKMPSLEAQIVNIADEIAYLNHDIDDGLRANILKIGDLEHISIWQKASEKVDSKLSVDLLVPTMISSIMSLMIDDLVTNTDKLINEFGINSVEQICSLDKLLSSFTKGIQDDSSKLKAFLYDNFYRSSGVSERNVKGQEVISFLFKKMMADFSLVPEKLKFNSSSDETYVLVKDYITGMTDQFALDLYEKLSK